MKKKKILKIFNDYSLIETAVSNAYEYMFAHKMLEDESTLIRMFVRQLVIVGIQEYQDIIRNRIENRIESKDFPWGDD